MGIDLERERNHVVMNDCLLSIIIPLYNAEDTIRRCVDSVVRQDLTNYEVLLIDDGSTDASGQICDEYAAKDSRFKVFHKENGGVSNARNEGLKHACGEWIYFVDADDCVESHALNTLLSHTSRKIDLVMCGYSVIDDFGNTIYAPQNRLVNEITYIDALHEMFVPTNKRYEGYLWCKLFRTSVIKDSALRFNEKIFFNEDRLFIVQFLCKSQKGVYYDSSPVYKYFERKTGAMESLKSSYNIKFATDFDAYVLMYEEIKKLPNASQLLWFAKNGIRQSYERNHQYMYQFKMCPTRIHWHMVKEMIRTGAFLPYFKDIIRPLIMIFCPRIYCKNSLNG